MNWKDELNKIKNELPKENDLRFIDTHAHYNSPQFKKNQKEVLENLRDELQYIINLGTNMKSNTETLQLISLYDYIYGMIGFFPTDTWQLEEEFCPRDVNNFVFNAKDNLLVFEKQLLNQKIVGIGEIGLDYHWDCIGDARKHKYCEGEESRKIQQKWFIHQLNMAKDRNLPVSMHSRDAEEDTIKVFNQFNEIKGVMHCFSYGMKSADIYLNKGLYLGIGGTSTYPSNNELREVIKNCPLDRILLETDAPYLSPQPVRRQVNISSYINYVIDNIADIKGISREEVIIKTNENAMNLFRLPKVFSEEEIQDYIDLVKKEMINLNATKKELNLMNRNIALNNLRQNRKAKDVAWSIMQ